MLVDDELDVEEVVVALWKNKLGLSVSTPTGVWLSLLGSFPQRCVVCGICAAPGLVCRQYSFVLATQPCRPRAYCLC